METTAKMSLKEQGSKGVDSENIVEYQPAADPSALEAERVSEATLGKASQLENLVRTTQAEPAAILPRSASYWKALEELERR